MKKSNILAIIIDCLRNYLEGQGLDNKIDETTELFGTNAILDSMGLVNLVIDIESKFLNDGIEISLVSEDAMSRRNSPFRTVSTLSNFINEQINKDAQNE